MSTSSTTAPLDLFAPAFAADPYPTYERLREEAPLYRDERFGWIVSRYDDVHRVLTHPHASTATYAAVEPMMGRTLLQLDGREHASRRRMIAPFFGRHAIESRATAIVREIVAAALKALRGEAAPDLVADYAAVIPIATIVALLGLPARELPRFRAWYRAMAAATSNLAADPEVQQRVVAMSVELRAYLRPVVAARRAVPEDDLISAMCWAGGGEDGGEPMTDEEVTDYCVMLLAAGGETTERAISNTLRNLLDHPDQLALVREDPSLLEGAVLETLRFRPPSQILMRLTTAPIELTSGAGTIPTDQVVVLLVGAAGRDPRRYADPLVFDVTRGERELQPGFSNGAGHLAFGAGRHFCAGTHLARLELLTALSRLLAAAPALRYRPGFTPVESGIVTRGQARIEVEGIA